MTRRAVCSSILRCCTGERSLSKIISGASLALASARISSSLPRPTSVAGSALSRSWKRVPAMAAPALRANSTNSTRDSRSGVPAGIPCTRGERFQATPTRRARSVEGMACVVFIVPGSKQSLPFYRSRKYLFASCRVYARCTCGGKCARITRTVWVVWPSILTLCIFNRLSESDQVPIRRQHQQFSLSVRLIHGAVDIARGKRVQFRLQFRVELIDIAKHQYSKRSVAYREARHRRPSAPRFACLLFRGEYTRDHGREIAFQNRECR